MDTRETTALTEILSRLSTVTDMVSAIRADLDNLLGGGTALVSEDVRRKAESGRCLFCDKEIESADRVVRGLHEKCYRFLNRQVKAGKVTELALIQAGKMLPTQSGGRKPSSDAEKLFRDLRAELDLESSAGDAVLDDHLAKRSSRKKPTDAASEKEAAVADAQRFAKKKTAKGRRKKSAKKNE